MVRRILFALVAISSLLMMTACGGQQNGPESAPQRFVMTLAELQDVDPDAYQAIEIVKELAPTAIEGKVSVPFVPVGILHKIPEVEEAILKDQSLCESIVGKNIIYNKTIYNKNGSEKLVYSVNANFFQYADEKRCEVSLDEITSTEKTNSITRLIPSNDLNDLALGKLENIRSPIVRTLILVNNQNQLSEIWLYEELKGYKGWLAKNLGVHSPPGPGGNPTYPTFIYNFVLDRAIEDDG